MALILMEVIYLSNIALMPFCTGILYAFDKALTLQTSSVKINSGVWSVLTIVHMTFWLFPTLIILLYLLFGQESNSFLFPNLSWLSVLLIEEVVPNGSFLLHSVSVLIFLI